MAPETRIYVLFGAVLFVAYLYYRIKDKYFRVRGVYIERRAVKGLRLPADWELIPDVPVPGLGNCDALIVNPADERYAVEIKSAQSAKKVWFSLFTKDEIRKASGQRFARDPVEQVNKVAERLDAQAVLWFPKASRSRSFKTRSGVIVVQGNERMLERAIGARRGWFWL